MLNMINLWQTGINKIMLWTTEIKKVYLWSTVIYWFQWITETDSYNLDKIWGISWYRWLKFITKYKLKLWIVTKHSSVTNWNCILKDSLWNTLSTITFSWNNADFWWYILNDNTEYRIEFINAAWSWNYTTQYNSDRVYPIINTHINCTWGSFNWSDNQDIWNINSITTTR